MARIHPPLGGDLRFRLDVSEYYVIRTIIILDVSVGDRGLEFLKVDAKSPAVPPWESASLE
jgi:hypothetical protein